MKTLQQHLDEQAYSLTGMTFTEILKDKCYTDIQVQEITDIVHVAAGAYAQQVSEDVRARCAKNVKITHHCGHTKENKSITYYQVGADNLQPDKQSIFNTEIILP